MAFDRPIEADRVDNLGLFSTFVRAPIVGPIMWMLGKNLIDNDADKDKENQLILTTVSTSNKDECFPDMSSSTISDIMNDSSIDENERNYTDTGQSSSFNRRKIIDSSIEESKVNELSTLCNSFQRKKSRKMSWSDESGASLVEYCDMSLSSYHQGTPPSMYYPAHKKKPIKSAMKRPCGVSKTTNDSSRVPHHPSQCIPSGLAGGSIVMPSGGGMSQNHNNQHYQQSSNNNNHPNHPNGYISPQYGWYISMTPPTPPHYPDTSSYSSSKNGQQVESQQVVRKQQLLRPQHNNNNGNMEQITMNNDNNIMKKSQGSVPINRPVFTRGLKGVPKHSISGWPSVPL